jgi:Group II intron, maturase-specific domain
MTTTQNLARPWGLLEPDAWKAGTSGSEGGRGAAMRPGYPTLPRPAAAQARHCEARGLHLPVEEGARRLVGRVRALTRRTAHPSLAAMLRQLNPALLGWCTYFKHGVSKATFGYLDEYTWRRFSTGCGGDTARRSGPSSTAASSTTGGQPRTG